MIALWALFGVMTTITLALSIHYEFGPIGSPFDKTSWSDMIYVKPWSRF